MAATRDEQLQNLARLRAGSHPHCSPSASRIGEAFRDAMRMPLTHTTAEKAMASILKAGALLAATEIPLPPRPDSAEAILGTRGDVFLYLCSMGYPDNEFGFLFDASLTDSVAGTAVATPFDSGGCVAKLLPPGGEDCVSFVRRHEIPVPDVATTSDTSSPDGLPKRVTISRENPAPAVAAFPSPILTDSPHGPV